MSDFHATKMGVQFYDGTMRDIARELKRGNDLLEELVTLLKNEDNKISVKKY